MTSLNLSDYLETFQGQSWLGRAYFESGDFSESAKCFSDALNKNPFYMVNQDYHSTALNHLQRSEELLYLAETLKKRKKNDAVVWSVMGNFYSIKGKSKEAMTCFQRAVRLRPNYAYACTLVAHELIDMEDWNLAESWFDEAIRINEKQYSAWYGLGLLSLVRPGKDLFLALSHFKQAEKINPYNAMLKCQIGQILMDQRDYEKAYETYSLATNLNPSLSDARIGRAYSTLRLIRSIKDERQRIQLCKTALNDVSRVIRSNSKNIQVHLVKAKLLVLLGRNDDAVKVLTIALGIIQEAKQELEKSEADTEADDVNEVELDDQDKLEETRSRVNDDEQRLLRTLQTITKSNVGAALSSDESQVTIPAKPLLKIAPDSDALLDDFLEDDEYRQGDYSGDVFYDDGQ